ncbi:phosphotransferase family protein [Actinoplanes sp. NPDC049265]|uniref:phosphotransferase family protein n=1 Tax=Actinoplanes sp. NPDC049265 TaxID=3363902 RepID=UPI003720012A
MRTEDGERIAKALGGRLVKATTLAGGYSHETTLLELDDRKVVARFGGGDPAIEAAVMALAPVPVPEVLLVEADAMAIGFVEGTVLSRVLETPPDAVEGLGREVGRVVARIGDVRFGAAGFFAGDGLTVGPQPPWSEQLVPFAEQCMAKTERLDRQERTAWLALCAEHAPALTAIDGEARLVHGDINPKNILVGGGRVTAVLDWEFAYSGCPYGDVANMARFGAGYPPGFLDGFVSGFEEHEPRHPDWQYLGRLLDLFALSDFMTRAPGQEVADQAATIVREWIATGVPRTTRSL